jgi:ABC-2 type transport system permease protein
MNVRRLRLIMWKEFLQLRRDRLLLPMVFVMPILQLVMFGYVVGSDVRNVPMVVVDYDHSQLSRQLVSAFSSSGYFVITKQATSENELVPLIDSGKAGMGIVIPAGMSNSILSGDVVPIGIVVDGADSKTASVASGYAAQIIAEFNRRTLGLAAKEARGPGFDARVRVVFNPSLKAVNAMIPGLMATILLLFIGTIMSQAVVKERARGTLEQMLVTPITRGEYLLGKVLPYALIGTVQASFIALVGRYWFRVPFNGNAITVVVTLGLFMLTCIGIGLLVSLVSATQQQAQQTILFIMLPMVVLSGFIFPIESMPAAIVPLTYFIPLRYAIVAMRGAFMKGTSTAYLWQPLLAMTAFAVLIFGIAVSRFSKKLSE